MRGFTLSPNSYIIKNMRLPSPKKRSPRGKIIAIALISIVIVYVGAMLFLPAPQPTVKLTIKSGDLQTGEKTDFDWPSTGNAAIGAKGFGVLQSNNGDAATPTASIAKVILAMAILKEKPLNQGDTGPEIKITQADEDLYNNDLAQNGSVVPVQIGQNLTEYQALQAVLLPSGNNIATTLANWGFGSVENYIKYAKTMLAEMGLSKTNLADASGYSPQTVSTPNELVLIGSKAMENPVFAEIVGQTSATIPVAGTVNNVNSVLGERDIDGIKTGNTDEAGGCFLFSATRAINGKPVTLIGAVMAMPKLSSALSAAPDLVDLGFENFVYAEGVSTDKPVGTVATDWGETSDIYAQKDISQVVWSGTPLKREVTTAPSLSGVVGRVKVGDLSTDLIAKTQLNQPSITWRLSHPFQIIGALFNK